MENIRYLFLDIGGVLLSNGWGHEFRQKAAKHFNLDIPEMEQRHKLLFVVYEEGRITLDEYLDRVVFYQKREFTSDQFKNFIFSLTTPNKEMIAFLKKIKQQYNLKIVAVSNEAREFNAHRISEFELIKLIDFFISSCYVHIRKPDANIFKMALDIAQVKPAQVVYIDDVQMFVDVATGLGIKSIRHKDYTSTTKELAQLGLISDKTLLSNEDISQTTIRSL